MADIHMSANIKIVPDQDTMTVILKLLDMWQDANPDKMVAMVPQKDRYGYEIIERGKPNE